MLQRIHDELGHDQAEALGLAGRGAAAFANHFQRDRPGVADHRGRKAVAQLGEIRRNFDCSDRRRCMQLFLHGGNRQDPLVRVFQMKTRLFRLHRARLHQNDAGDDLQAVGNSVLQFLEQGVFLPQQLVLFALQDAPLGDVLHAEQNRRAGAALVEHLAGVQAHRAESDAGEFMLDFIALHHALLGYDFFQQHAKLWNVPLSIAQRVKKPALGVLGADLECRIEGAARGDHAQVFVEHKNRLADSVDNALSERPRIGDGGELVPEAVCLHQAPARYFRAANKDFGRVPVAAMRRSTNLDAYALYRGRVCIKQTTIFRRACEIVTRAFSTAARYPAGLATCFTMFSDGCIYMERL